MKQKLNTEIDSEVLYKLHNYAVVKLNSDSEIVEKAIKSYLNDHPLDIRKELPAIDIIKKGPLCTLLKPREKRKLSNILKEEIVYNHGKTDYLAPSEGEGNLYYVVSGLYFERREVISSQGDVSITQDLISEDEIFGEEFVDNSFSSYWDANCESRLLKISPNIKEQLIKKIPKFKDNLDYLISQKFRKMDYISTVRSSHLCAEDKVRYAFNFLVQRLGHTINGDLSRNKISLDFAGTTLPMGAYSDYGVLKRIMYDDVADLVSLSRESISRVLNNMCFSLNEKNFRIGFSERGHTYVFKDLLNSEGKINKLQDLLN